MFIFCSEIHIALPSSSLKEKRRIVKSILGRARNRFNISCAEVGLQEMRAETVLGFVTVSSDKVIARKLLERVEDWIYEDWPDLGIMASNITEL